MDLHALTENDILRHASSTEIFKRGKEYWHRGRVEAIRQKGNYLEVNVRGSKRYTVTLHVDNKKLIAGCTCPYEGEQCKHVVAALYALMHQAKGRETEAVTKHSRKPFAAFLKLSDAVFQASSGTILRAFELLVHGHVTILRDTHELACLEVKEGERIARVIIEHHPWEKRSEMTLWKRCSCGYSYFKEPCVHRVAAMLSLIKKHNPHVISAHYEQKIREEYNREQYETMFAELAEMRHGQEEERNVPELKKYRLFFSLAPERHNTMIETYIVRAQVKKNGALGALKRVNLHALGKYYADCPEEMQRALDRMISPLYNMLWQNELYYSPRKQQQETKVIEMLRDLYAKHPEYFIDCAIAQEKVIPEIAIHRHAKNQRYAWSLSLKYNGIPYDLASPEIILFGGKTLWAYIPQKVNSTEKGLLAEVETTNQRTLHFIREHSAMEFTEQQVKEIIEKKYTALAQVGTIALPASFKPRERNDVIPTLRLFLKEKEGALEIEPRFRYLDQEVSALQYHDLVFQEANGTLSKIVRNTAEEQRFLSLLSEGTIRHGERYAPAGDPLEWLADHAPRLIASGCELFGSDKLLNSPISPARPKLALYVTSGIDWFDIKADLSFDKQKVPLAALIKAINNHERWIELADGSLGAIPKPWIEKIAGTLGFLEHNKKEESLRAARTQFKIIDALTELAETKQVDETFKEMREKFKKFEKIEDVSLPKELNGTLREYQKAGYNWLHFLREFSFGGCLADEMGLGKTIQVLALLLSEKENNHMNHPSLIVVPTSLIFNWQHEIQKFTPSLTAYVHHGQERKKELTSQNADKSDLIITTYETLCKDEELFLKEQFHYIILDESQKIKNPITKNARTVTRLHGKHKLVLTGTPIENNYLDLWSQFTFLNPGLLGNHEHFKNKFVAPVEKEKKDTTVKTLKNIINPFILMRKKEMVAQDLPEKQINTLYGAFDPRQETFYNEWKQRYQREIRETIEKQGLQKSKLKVLEGLLRLRQICNHPTLVDASYRGSSAKLSMLLEYIEETHATGRKALIFSSFVKMLQLIQKELEKQGISYAYLDGSTRNRGSVVAEFQANENVKLFLGSLKAGGLGLNLTAAEQVFIVDPWWNPAAEMQAIDRAHRIGQDKKVFVYKIIMKNTIEEKILALQQSKQQLVQEIMLHEENVFKKLSKEEVLQLFA